MAKRLALVFPGQGSQRVGMAAELLAHWPRVTRDTLAEASEAARVDLLALLRDGPQQALTRTDAAQPAILSLSVAVLRVLREEAGLDVSARAAFVLGHSLGEYSALVAADALTFADAVKLVVRVASSSRQEGWWCVLTCVLSCESSASAARRCRRRWLPGSAPWRRSCP